MAEADVKYGTVKDLDIPSLDRQNHGDSSLHLIGDALPTPSVVSSVGTASVGTSPYPAREDHVHGYGVDDYGTAFPTTGLYTGKKFIRTDKMREYIYDAGAWWRLHPLSGLGIMRMQVRRVAAQTITTATLTDVSWDTEDTDSEGSFAVAITNFSIPNDILAGTSHAGNWHFGGFVLWSAAPGADNFVWVQHSGGDIITFCGNNNALSLSRAFSVPAYRWGSGTVKVGVYQNSGSNKTITGKFWLEWKSP